MEERFRVLTVTKGNVKTFLGMKIIHLNTRRVVVNIKGYILEALQEFG